MKDPALHPPSPLGYTRAGLVGPATVLDAPSIPGLVPEQTASAMSDWLHRHGVLMAGPVIALPAASGLSADVARFAAVIGPGHEAVLEAAWHAVNPHSPTGRLETAIALAQASRAPNYAAREILMRAAAKGVPVVPVHDGVWSLGEGSRQRWVNATLFAHTRWLGARLARDKHAASRWLARAGLPVAPQATLSSIEQVHQFISIHGFPVVLKPRAFEGGYGVHADLRDMDEVYGALRALERLKTALIIEKHVPGRDFRITVAGGRVISILERQPAGVTGDGQRTISELVDVTNADPRRSGSPTSTLAPITLDAESERLMRHAGVTAGTVLEAGRWLRLKAAGNVKQGGIPVRYDGVMHEDNLDLALRASRICDVDPSGVDLLLPDPARSWLQGGAAICEVNAQPSVGPAAGDVAWQCLMGSAVESDGLITKAAFALGAGTQATLAAWRCELERLGAIVGWNDGAVVYVGDRCIGRAVDRASAAAQILRDPTVDAALFDVQGEDFAEGLPFTALDALVSPAPPPVAGSGLHAITRRIAGDPEALLGHLLDRYRDRRGGVI